MKRKTVHVHRTIMSYELEKVMDFGLENDEYQKALESNVFGKKSADGIKQTSNFLRKIYSFYPTQPFFSALKHFWRISSPKEKSLITFLFAFTHDYLLYESAAVVKDISLGEKVTLEMFKDNLEKFYPNKYSKVTSQFWEFLVAREGLPGIIFI